MPNYDNPMRWKSCRLSNIKPLGIFVYSIALISKPIRHRNVQVWKIEDEIQGSITVQWRTLDVQPNFILPTDIFGMFVFKAIAISI